MLEIYKKYLNNIDATIQEFFERQKPYIYCQKGCSLCCETGEYPISELEFEYMKSGYNKLNENKKNIIQEKINFLKEQKKICSERKFLHECPFLIEKQCSIYQYRGLICRNHGLMYHTVNKQGKQICSIPHCVNDGLNYSNVFDKITGTISSVKWIESGIEVEPVAYNIGTKFLYDNHTTQSLGLKFGEEKAILDWFD